MNSNWRTLVFLFSTLLLTFLFVNLVLLPKPNAVFIDGDGSGHYAYLPAILLNHSVDFSAVLASEKARKSADYVGHNYHEINGVTINKFTFGTAIMLSPFFILAAIISHWAGLPVDGYNIVFQYAVGVGAVFWCTIGLFFLIKLLVLFHISRRVAGRAAVLGLFSTNLFMYSYIAPSFSHVYSFSVIAAFAYFVARFFLNLKARDLYLASFLFGMIIVIRPVNGLVVLLVPFLAGGFPAFWKWVRNKLSARLVLISLLIFVFALSPQIIINFLQTGSLWIDGYREEGFDFLTPHFLDFLFSYQKGWFVYTPVMLLLFPSAIFLYRRKRESFYPFLFFFIPMVYVFSSWWNWFYGDSFGMRPMVDYYAVFILIIATYYFNAKSKYTKKLVLAFIGLAMFLNLFQTYQYAIGIIHPDSMNKKAYWHVFLRSDANYRGVVAGNDEYYYGKLDEIPFVSSLNTIDRLPVGWTLNEKSVMYNPEAGSLVIEQNNALIYSPSFVYPYPDHWRDTTKVYVRFSFSYLEKEVDAALNALVVVDITDTLGQHPFYKAFRFKRLPDETTGLWRKGSVGFKLPPHSADYEQIKFYIWNREAQNYLLDSLQIEMYQY
ncbi:MAG: hypothetical protein KKF98_10070 [Bacteroidetes bacterium]|nr:hypothetical protein [Bacteroidota bacterium]